MPHAQQHDSAFAQVEKSIVAARGGSDSALGRLLEHYRDYLLRLANDELNSDLVPKVAPSDLVQETLLRASQSFPAFRGGTEGELRAWLRTILVHKLRDTSRQYYQRQKRAVSRELPLDVDGGPTGEMQELECARPAPQRQLLEAELSARVQAALITLPDVYRQVIELRHIQRLSLREIGQQLGRSPEAVRKLWCRAVERLSRELAEYRPDRS